MEQLVGMEHENKIRFNTLILAILSSFILCGCSESQVVQSQPPVVVKEGTTGNSVANTQKPVDKKGDEICEDFLLRKIAIAKEKDEHSRLVKLKEFNSDDGTYSLELKEWLKNADEEKLVAFELAHKEKKALLLHSVNVRATGLAVNFQYWYIRLDNYSFEFISLSENPELIFWDRNGFLNYYSVDYGDQFLSNKDWDNLTLDLLRYKISPNGESKLVSEELNMKCE